MIRSKTSPSRAPFIRAASTASDFLWKRSAALLIPAAAAVFFYGPAALALFAASAAAAVLAERAMGFILKKPVPFQGGHALGIGLTLALMLPPGLPLWMAVLGAVFAVAVARDAFGGPGQAPLPPILAGFLFLAVSFPLEMRAVTDPVTGHAAAHGLAWLKDGVADSGLHLSRIFMTPQPGGAGMVFFPALAAAGLLLIFQRLVFWELPFLFLAASALTAFGFGEHPAAALAGSNAFAAFFLISEGMTAPHNRHGARFFALLAGFLAAALRQVSGAFDPSAAAVMMVSFLTPWLEEAGRTERGWAPPRGASA